MSTDKELKDAELSTFKAIEQFKSVISMAELSLKSSIVINGGAAVAILTFVGNSKIVDKSQLVFGLLSFSLGVFLASVATLFGYLAQNNYLESQEKKGDKYRDCAILICGVSYLFFFIGIVSVAFGLIKIGT